MKTQLSIKDCSNDMLSSKKLIKKNFELFKISCGTMDDRIFIKLEQLFLRYSGSIKNRNEFQQCFMDFVFENYKKREIEANGDCIASWKVMLEKFTLSSEYRKLIFSNLINHRLLEKPSEAEFKVILKSKFIPFVKYGSQITDDHISNLYDSLTYLDTNLKLLWVCVAMEKLVKHGEITPPLNRNIIFEDLYTKAQQEIKEINFGSTVEKSFNKDLSRFRDFCVNFHITGINKVKVFKSHATESFSCTRVFKEVMEYICPSIGNAIIGVKGNSADWKLYSYIDQKIIIKSDYRISTRRELIEHKLNEIHKNWLTEVTKEYFLKGYADISIQFYQLTDVISNYINCIDFFEDDDYTNKVMDNFKNRSDYPKKNDYLNLSDEEFADIISSYLQEKVNNEKIREKSLVEARKQYE